MGRAPSRPPAQRRGAPLGTREGTPAAGVPPLRGPAAALLKGSGLAAVRQGQDAWLFPSLGASARITRSAGLSASPGLLAVPQPPADLETSLDDTLTSMPECRRTIKASVPRFISKLKRLI